MVKVGFGSIGDSFSVSSFKSYLSELIATLIFVFAGVGSAIAYGKLTSDAALDPPGLLAVAVAHAFALFVGVSVTANISGGHLNPAITLGLPRLDLRLPPPQIRHCRHVTVITGGYQWKYVSVYISKSSQVKLKLENKHVGGTFSKNTKCVVFGVCDEISTWPYGMERDTTEEVYFGLRTGKGFIEFQCKNKARKQRWVDAVWNLLRHCSVGNLSLSSSMST